MPSEAFKLALYDIRDNILLAQRFVENLTFEGFKASRLHCYAVTRALEIVSDARGRGRRPSTRNDTAHMM
jgi:uncharacterized protein with HEPN domain